MTTQTLVLVDGSSYLFRAYHALPALSNSSGQPTGAIHGVISMLRKLRRDYDPDYFAVVFDPPGKTFRDELYPQYKANRPPMPDDLRVQIEPLFDIIRALGVPLLVVDGVEADDVIGTLATRANNGGIRTIISSSDKDLTQLVNDDVTVVNTMDDRMLDRDGVAKKFGVPPERMLDYLTLIGDSVDNVPGVPKVGPKTAVKWLEEYGSLDAIIARSGEIKGKVGENLRASLGYLPLTRRLLELKCDVDAPGLEPTALAVAAPDRERLEKLYTALEFKTWLKELREQAPAGEVPGGRAAPDTRYQTILERAELDAWLARLRSAAMFAFDTETTSLDYIEAEVVGVSFAIEPGEAAYVPLAHDYPGAPGQLDRDEVLAALAPLLEDRDLPKLGHNLKYDRSVLANHGIELSGIAFDTMLESYVLDSTATRHDMDSLALKYLGLRTIHYEDVAGRGAHQMPFNRVAIEQAGPYAAEDADVCLRLHRTLWPRFETEAGLRRLFQEIEMPLVPVLSRIERRGVCIDADMLRAQSRELSHRMDAIEREAREIAGHAFNLGSPKQIQQVLFEQLKLPVIEKTPKGQPSTAETVLETLALDYPLPKLILDHRALAKLKSTYTDRLPECVSPRTGRVHTSYHQAVAATGRLSSSEPNLQNIPIRSSDGRRIRQAFVAPGGRRLVAADYSQIELRIMAHLSGDERLRAAFAAGEDIHRATAAEVFGAAPEQVSDEQRRAAKAINFGLIYGMSAYGLARNLGIERAAAQEYVERYFSRYPGVKGFMDGTRAQARSRGYVETVFGRRLHLPEINSRNVQRRQYAERTAINAPMQGTAADIIKRAMIAVDRWLGESRVDAHMIMQVHDELVLEVDERVVEEVVPRVREIMEAAAALAVPLVVDVGIGCNWDEAH
jgi:DNA polymerase-1